MNQRLAASFSRARQQHQALEELADSLNMNNEFSGVQIWRKLRRIEGEARRATTAYCNGTITEQACDEACTLVMGAVRRVFTALPTGFFINRDPRGYALKLEPESVPFKLEEDWGRYQILAPEIN